MLSKLEDYISDFRTCHTHSNFVSDIVDLYLKNRMRAEAVLASKQMRRAQYDSRSAFRATCSYSAT